MSTWRFQFPLISTDRHVTTGWISARDGRSSGNVSDLDRDRLWLDAVRAKASQWSANARPYGFVVEPDARAIRQNSLHLATLVAVVAADKNRNPLDQMGFANEEVWFTGSLTKDGQRLLAMDDADAKSKLETFLHHECRARVMFAPWTLEKVTSGTVRVLSIHEFAELRRQRTGLREAKQPRGPKILVVLEQGDVTAFLNALFGASETTDAPVLLEAPSRVDASVGSIKPQPKRRSPRVLLSIATLLLAAVIAFGAVFRRVGSEDGIATTDIEHNDPVGPWRISLVPLDRRRRQFRISTWPTDGQLLGIAAEQNARLAPLGYLVRGDHDRQTVGLLSYGEGFAATSAEVSGHYVVFDPQNPPPEISFWVPPAAMSGTGDGGYSVIADAPISIGVLSWLYIWNRQGAFVGPGLAVYSYSSTREGGRALNVDCFVADVAGDIGIAAPLEDLHGSLESRRRCWLVDPWTVERCRAFYREHPRLSDQYELFVDTMTRRCREGAE